MPTLAEKILKFAQTHRGKKVGAGECWDLAEEALKKAGAKTSRSFGKITRNANYKWGKAVNLGQAQKGDVIQYRNYKWVKRVTSQDRSWEESEFTFDHHTAILANKKSNGMWEVYEQNVSGKRYVMRNSVYLKKAQYTDNQGRKIKITVSGRFWIYRPVKR